MIWLWLCGVAMVPFVDRRVGLSCDMREIRLCGEHTIDSTRDDIDSKNKIKSNQTKDISKINSKSNGKLSCCISFILSIFFYFFTLNIQMQRIYKGPKLNEIAERLA
ncbi:uncharacterized protein [Prorops nasuta]|uniref:uncharacterized protein n=1 Tax=Prorops nasuta TaxID=863751 RepID=UPI0034CDFAE1